MDNVKEWTSLPMTELLTMPLSLIKGIKKERKEKKRKAKLISVYQINSFVR